MRAKSPVEQERPLSQPGTFEADFFKSRNYFFLFLISTAQRLVN